MVLCLYQNYLEVLTFVSQSLASWLASWLASMVQFKGSSEATEAFVRVTHYRRTYLSLSWTVYHCYHCWGYLSAFPKRVSSPIRYLGVSLLSKQEGGLGIRDLVWWNKASSIKMVWLLFFRGGSIWVAWFIENILSGNLSNLWTLTMEEARGSGPTIGAPSVTSGVTLNYLHLLVLVSDPPQHSRTFIGKTDGLCHSLDQRPCWTSMFSSHLLLYRRNQMSLSGHRLEHRYQASLKEWSTTPSNIMSRRWPGAKSSGLPEAFLVITSWLGW